MKLLRWAVAGAASASVYVVYRYSIGKKAKGEDVFTSPDDTVAKLDDARKAKAKAATAKPAPAKSAPAKPKAPAAKPRAKARESSKS
jgi:hypothetical protein